MIFASVDNKFLYEGFKQKKQKQNKVPFGWINILD